MNQRTAHLECALTLHECQRKLASVAQLLIRIGYDAEPGSLTSELFMIQAKLLAFAALLDVVNDQEHGNRKDDGL